MIGAVGEHGLVFVIEQFFKDLFVVHTGGRGGGDQDDLGRQIGLHMVLPAIVDLDVLLGPARLAVFLAAHGRVGVELFGALALLDTLVLLALVALVRGVLKAGVNDDAFAFEDPAEGIEELAPALASIGLDALFEVPERLGVGDVVADAKAEKAFKAGAVEYLLLGGVVAEAVELLQHEDFEHEHRVERRLASLGPVAGGVADEFFEQRVEALPGNDVAQHEDASGFGSNSLLALNGREQSAASFCLVVTLHGPFKARVCVQKKSCPGK